jgi:hypothetical protein
MRIHDGTIIEDNENIDNLFSSLMEDIDGKLELNKSILSKVFLGKQKIT